MSQSQPTLYTIGHSNHDWVTFRHRYNSLLNHGRNSVKLRVQEAGQRRSTSA